ncbi:Gfo/Idh/MocA family oxidoreductase, partial [bacterium]|nr:Gfo/Idh/MocA family oxidoreductase [bacterium]
TETPGIRAVAVCDQRPDAARAAADQHGVPAVYTDADALLADQQVEAVVLALPTAGRAAVARRAFARGKHVLLEKPVGMNAAEVEELIAVRGSLVAGCCSSRQRFTQSAQAATEFLATHPLGSLRVVRARAVKPAGPPPQSPPPPWRLNRALNSGGILVNWGSYDLDFLLGITGWSLRPRTVLARTWPVGPAYTDRAAPGSDAETHGVVLILCDGGTVISFERAEFAAAATDEAWQVLGETGSLRLRLTPAAEDQVWYDAADPQQGVVTRTIWQGNEEPLANHRGVLQDFVAAVRDGRPPRTTLEQALVVQKITDAIYESAARGVAVEIL